MPKNTGGIPRLTFPSATSLDDLARNLADVRGRMDAAARRAGRNPADVQLLPVSKTVPEGRIRLALAAGCTVLGENKVQEAKWKSLALADVDVRWSLVGHLQTNKVKDVVPFISEFQALDNLRVAEMLDRRLQGEGRELKVYVQVNTSNEESKYGLEPQVVPSFLRLLRRLSSLRVEGLMTLAEFTTDGARVRECFTVLRNVRDRARDEDPDLLGTGLSMGMSGDFETAIEEGATCVRVGQAIFGARSTPNSHYWPAEDQERH